MPYKFQKKDRQQSRCEEKIGFSQNQADQNQTENYVEFTHYLNKKKFFENSKEKQKQNCDIIHQISANEVYHLYGLQYERFHINEDLENNNPAHSRYLFWETFLKNQTKKRTKEFIELLFPKTDISRTEEVLLNLQEALNYEVINIKQPTLFHRVKNLVKNIPTATIGEYFHSCEGLKWLIHSDITLNFLLLYGSNDQQKYLQENIIFKEDCDVRDEAITISRLITANFCKLFHQARNENDSHIAYRLLRASTEEQFFTILFTSYEEKEGKNNPLEHVKKIMTYEQEQLNTSYLLQHIEYLIQQLSPQKCGQYHLLYADRGIQNFLITHMSDEQKNYFRNIPRGMGIF